MQWGGYNNPLVWGGDLLCSLDFILSFLVKETRLKAMQCITPYNPGVSNVIIPDLMKVEQAQHMMEEVEAVIISPVIITHS